MDRAMLYDGQWYGAYMVSVSSICVSCFDVRLIATMRPGRFLVLP